MTPDPNPSRRVVVVDGCRTPFCRSGTAFADTSTYDLGRMAVSGLLHRTRIDPAAVEMLVMGTVIADPATSNLGREVVLGSQLPDSCPAFTVSVACVSSREQWVGRSAMSSTIDTAHARLGSDSRFIVDSWMTMCAVASFSGGIPRAIACE